MEISDAGTNRLWRPRQYKELETGAIIPNEPELRTRPRSSFLLKADGGLGSSPANR